MGEGERRGRDGRLGDGRRGFVGAGAGEDVEALSLWIWVICCASQSGSGTEK